MALGPWHVVVGVSILIIAFYCMYRSLARIVELEEELADAQDAARSAFHAHSPVPLQVVVERRAAGPVAAPAVKIELGYFPYSATAVKDGVSGASAVVCAICMEELVEGATCSEVPACRHLFHRDCIQLWMKSKSTCPLCRVRIVPGSEPLPAAQDMV